jgi:NAD+ synthase
MNMYQSVTTISDVLQIDAVAETNRIVDAIRRILTQKLRRKGLVVGASGGIDSSVVAALCVRAVGKDRVIALLMPEKESSADSTQLGQKLADHLGIATVTEDITSTLEAAGCYRRRDEAIRQVVPEYGAGYKSKIVLPDLLNGNSYSIFSVVVQSPTNERTKIRLTLGAYLGVVAATNFKQRVRAMMEYYHADRLNYAVAGTPNKLEHDLGFFVKNGDGSADLKPIAHLYKSQVYQLAAQLDIPEEIQRRRPTTDTYSLEQSQEEFYFSMPLEMMDLCLYGRDHNLSAAELASIAGMQHEQVAAAYASIDSKRRACEYLKLPPELM